MRLAALLTFLMAAPVAGAPPAGVHIEHTPALARPWGQPTLPVISESRAPDGTVITYLDGWGMEQLELVTDQSGRRMVCSGPDRPLPQRRDFRWHRQRGEEADAAR
ncbi:MAG: hypothetical protein KF823_13165 [Xanthomonadales bacterium]|nr:hypothetical protein [Xanthomonadales bacterium]